MRKKIEDVNDNTVYSTRKRWSGKYHSEKTCTGLLRSKDITRGNVDEKVREWTVEEAERAWLEPCDHCVGGLDGNGRGQDL